MSALFTAFVTVILMSSSFQQEISAETNDDDLVQEFRGLFAEFLRDPERHHSSKRVRDTSGNGKRQPRHDSKQTKRDETEEKRSTDRLDLRSLYPCNYFDASTRSCVNVRQLGTTLTIGVRIESKELSKFPIHWYRFFKVRGEDEGKSLKFVKLTRATLDEGSPEEVQKKSKKRLQLLRFSIEPINIDMGTLYHGEEITVNVRSFMELPRKSVLYEWATIGEDYGVRHNLPSNMKLNHDGSSIIIKEHRSYGDMVLTCAIFSNKDFNVARRNFFLRKIVSIKSPNVKIESGAVFTRKRRYLDEFYAQPDMGRLSKWKRNSDVPSGENPDIVIEPQVESYATPAFNQSARSNYFSEIDNPLATSDFDLIDKPQETVLNLYGSPSTPEYLELETGVLQVSSGKQDSKPQSVDELIGEANEVVQQPQVEKSGQQYPTNRIVVEERLTAEDRESLMIADCKDDSECGINAVCFKIERNRKFCRCKPHYRGNGMFCWSF